MTDQFDVYYSDNGKVLEKCYNSKLQHYTIQEGCERIGDNAFLLCSNLRSIIVLFTLDMMLFRDVVV